MKATLTTSRPIRSVFPSPEVVPFVCLLGLASLLAIVGGIATSALFFGLLLLFSLLLLVSRHLSTPRRQGVASRQAN
jgi:hypothetical protein